MSRGITHLKLVISTQEEETETVQSDPSIDPIQLPLFLLPSPGFLGLVDMPRVHAAPFITLLNELRPLWIMDLRLIPHFDLGGTSRSWFFNLFRQLGIRYFDISGLLGITTRKDSSLSSGRVAQAISSIIAPAASESRFGPMLVLLDDAESISVAARTLPIMIQPSPKDGWSIHYLDDGLSARPVLTGRLLF